MTREAKRQRREQHEEAHAARMAEVRERAAGVSIGATRESVERIFPSEDGGMSSETTTYYEEPEVKIAIRFDDTGGFYEPSNLVTAAPRIYRGRPTMD